MPDTKTVRVLLGAKDGKNYFLTRHIDKETGKAVKEAIEWKVPDIREAIQAEPGMRVLSSDYSQIEVKLMAFLSGDPDLIAAINSGKDVHSYNAVKVFGAKLDFDYELMEKARKDDTHPRHNELVTIRSNIKTTTFGVPYGAGPKRVADMTGMTEEKAAEFIEEFFNSFPVLKAWLDKVGSDAIYYGFTTSPRGRKRFYPMPSQDHPDRDGILSQIKRWAGNHPIQAGNVDMLKPSMGAIYRRLRALNIPYEDARILFVVHDEIVMTCKEELVPIVESIMREEMEFAYQSIIKGAIKNKIDVSNDITWKKA